MPAGSIDFQILARDSRALSDQCCDGTYFFRVVLLPKQVREGDGRTQCRICAVTLPLWCVLKTSAFTSRWASLSMQGLRKLREMLSTASSLTASTTELKLAKDVYTLSALIYLPEGSANIEFAHRSKLGTRIRIRSRTRIAADSAQPFCFMSSCILTLGFEEDTSKTINPHWGSMGLSSHETSPVNVVFSQRRKTSSLMLLARGGRSSESMLSLIASIVDSTASNLGDRVRFGCIFQSFLNGNSPFYIVTLSNGTPSCDATVLHFPLAAFERVHCVAGIAVWLAWKLSKTTTKNHLSSEMKKTNEEFSIVWRSKREGPKALWKLF